MKPSRSTTLARPRRRPLRPATDTGGASPPIALALLLAACASVPAAPPAPVATLPSLAVSAPPTRDLAAPAAQGACRRLVSPAERAQGLVDARVAHARAPGERAVGLALARCTHLAADSETDDARIIALSEEGMAALTRASLAADDAEAAYVYALNLGLYVRARGMTAVGRLSELVARLRLAGQQPALDEGGPLRVLGLLYVKAPGWPMGPGDLEAALDLLRRGVRDFPDHPLNHLYLAYALVDAGQRTQARAELTRARDLCRPERFGEWAARWRDEAEQLAERAR